MDSHSLTVRKRPSQERAQATVAAIVEAAARILEEAGLEAFNTNAVAARAGVSVGSLYQYFPGKAAILAALIEADFEAFESQLRAAVDMTAGASLADGVRAIAAVAVGHQAERPRLAKLLDVSEAGMALGPVLHARQAAILDAARAFLEAHRQEVAVTDLEVAAMDCLAITRAVVDGAAQDEPPVADQLEARVRRALMGYLTWTDQPGT